MLDNVREEDGKRRNPKGVMRCHLIMISDPERGTFGSGTDYCAMEARSTEVDAAIISPARSDAHESPFIHN